MRLDLHDKTGDRAIIALRTPYIFDYALHKMPAIGIAHNYFNSAVTTVILDIILVKPSSLLKIYSVYQTQAHVLPLSTGFTKI